MVHIGCKNSPDNAYNKMCHVLHPPKKNAVLLLGRCFLLRTKKNPASNDTQPGGA